MEYCGSLLCIFPISQVLSSCSLLPEKSCVLYFVPFYTFDLSIGKIHTVYTIIITYIFRLPLKLSQVNLECKLEVVKQEMGRVNIDILGIRVLKCTGMCEVNLDDDYISYCGQESLRRSGLALRVNKRVLNAVLGCDLKNDRMMSVPFQGKPFNTTVIQVFAPNSNAEEAEWFYEDLQDLLELTPKKDVLCITGDLNAKVGSQEIPGVTGKFGLRVQNEAGQRLTEFCQENTLVIANTLFQKHKRRLYTWTSLDGQYQNQIDYILCSQIWRRSIQSAKTRLGADCGGSDHELVIAKFRLKLKKVGKTTRLFKYDLNQIPCDYIVEGTNRFKRLALMATHCLCNKIQTPKLDIQDPFINRFADFSFQTLFLHFLNFQN